MTFKHIGFTDSSVMRSLEKVAIEKGLVKPEVMTKSAEALVAERDLSPTNNFSQDIIKLCNGLRRSGFNKHAEDIELHFAQYKKAQTLYETFKEKGEDLVESAHPDGPHVFEDVEGKPKVLDIVSRQKEIMKIVDKQPRGKLAKINNFKTSLAAATVDQNSDAVTKARTLIKDALTLYEKVIRPKAQKELGVSVKDVISVTPDMLNFKYENSLPTKAQLQKNVLSFTTSKSIKGLQDRFKSIVSKITPFGSEDETSTFTRMGVTAATYQELEPFIQRFNELVGDDQTNDIEGDTAYNIVKKVEPEDGGSSDSSGDVDEIMKRGPSSGGGGSVGRGRDSTGGTGDGDEPPIPTRDPNTGTEPPPVPVLTPPAGTNTSPSGQRTPAQQEQDYLYVETFLIINNNIKRLNSFKAVERVREDNNLLSWIDFLIKYFRDIQISYSKVEDKISVFDNLKHDTQKGINSVNKFYKKYVELQPPKSEKKIIK